MIVEAFIEKILFVVSFATPLNAQICFDRTPVSLGNLIDPDLLQWNAEIRTSLDFGQSKIIRLEIIWISDNV